MSEGAQKVPFSDSKCPEGAVGPERVRQAGHGQSRPGRDAAAPAARGDGEGNNAGSRGRKERHDLMAVTNEQRAHMTQRGKEKRAGGGRGSVSFRQRRGQPPQRRHGQRAH